MEFQISNKVIGKLADKNVTFDMVKKINSALKISEAKDRYRIFMPKPFVGKTLTISKRCKEGKTLATLIKNNIETRIVINLDGWVYRTFLKGMDWMGSR